MRQLIDRPMDALAKRFPQFSIALTSGLWGLVLLLPFDTFSTSQGYAVLANFAPEYVIGLLVGVVGFVNLHALVIEQWWLHRKTAVILMVFWLLVTIVFFTAAPSGASWVLLAGLAWLHGWSAVIGRQACSCYELH